MPRVRIVLATYQRHSLLRRALESLVAQTYLNWRCEVHNDFPNDSVPEQIVQAINDARIRCVNHRENLGANSTFDLLFASGSEEFLSLLEDDNWWEPTFLAEMVKALDDHPHVDVAWANMHCWREESDGTWTNLGRTIWNCGSDESSRLIMWPQLRQVTDALHSNGAMLLRSQHAERYRIPSSVLFDCIESFRERSFPQSLLFVPKPLANFATTLTTARKATLFQWAASQTLLAATFLESVPISDLGLAELWAYRRSLTPRSTVVLFQVAALGIISLRLLRYATPRDWIDFLRSFVAHPIIMLKLLCLRQSHQELWLFLARQTERLTEEARGLGFRQLGAGSISSKRV